MTDTKTNAKTNAIAKPDRAPRQPGLNAMKLWRYRRIFQWTQEWNAAQTSEDAEAANKRFARMK